MLCPGWPPHLLALKRRQQQSSKRANPCITATVPDVKQQFTAAAQQLCACDCWRERTHTAGTATIAGPCQLFNAWYRHSSQQPAHRYTTGRRGIVPMLPQLQRLRVVSCALLFSQVSGQAQPQGCFLAQ
jgi:hypothetical protein